MKIYEIDVFIIKNPRNFRNGYFQKYHVDHIKRRFNSILAYI